MEFETLIERVVYDLTGKELSSKWGKTNCVFHDDRIASAVWNEKYYKCFSCGVSGSPVGLLHDQGGMEWRDAFARIEELDGGNGKSISRTTRSGYALPGKSRNPQRNRRFANPGIRRRTSGG